MARTPTKPKAPRKAAQPQVTPAARKAGSDADREMRALDNAARRVPVWQVSAVSALMVLSETAGVTAADRIKLVLGQVPDAVIHAAKMHRRGQWKPL